MKKSIPIKVLTRLQQPYEDFALKEFDGFSDEQLLCFQRLAKVDGKIYDVSWINK